MNDRRMPPLQPDTLGEAQRALYDELTGGPRARGRQYFPLATSDGTLRGPFDAFLRSPSIGGALQRLGSAIRFESRLSDRAREIAILLVAARWRSDFERESHEAVGRGVGLTDAELRSLGSEEVTAFEGTEGLVASVTVALLDGDLDDALWATAVAELGDAAVFELTTLVGYYATLALQLRVFRIDGRVDDVGE